MAITYEMIKAVSAALYERSLKGIPEDTKAALRSSIATETEDAAKKTLTFMLKSAEHAERENKFVCSDAGIPVYFMKIGSEARLEGDIKQAFVDGFDHLVKTIEPPLLQFVTNPLTNERSYRGKDMPIVTYDLVSGVDYVELICSPKALGSGRWAAMKIMTYPKLDEIERYIMEVVMEAAGQHCPPVMIGIGIGGSFDYAAKLAKLSTLRPLGSKNPEPILAAMEERLLKAVNETGFGPMGVGGGTTALGVHIDYSSGHGFTPVAVCFNCWINRRTRARLYNSGKIEYLE